MERIHCEWCQRPIREIGDCGYCRNCCEARCTHKNCDCFASEVPDRDTSQRWQIRGREMARAVHRLAPHNDQDALLLLEGALDEGWITAAEVDLSIRARACAIRRDASAKVDAPAANDPH